MATHVGDQSAPAPPFNGGGGYSMDDADIAHARSDWDRWNGKGLCPELLLIMVHPKHGTGQGPFVSQTVFSPKHGTGQGPFVSQTVLSPKHGTRKRDKAIVCPEQCET
ncbi:hypothetical protein Bbelb_057270 [Branchiostoma belcheri]|nr:hypothetical protein Bbelb_057270 [Branchiostoma belcheri]